MAAPAPDWIWEPLMVMARKPRSTVKAKEQSGSPTLQWYVPVCLCSQIDVADVGERAIDKPETKL